MITLVIVLALFGIAYSVKKTLAFWTLHQAVHLNSSQNLASEDTNPINRFPLKIRAFPVICMIRPTEPDTTLIN